jgi:hypothetical protein
VTAGSLSAAAESVALRHLRRRRDESAERVLFALTANRVLAPFSKLAATRWVNEDVLITVLPVTSDDACHRAMGRLLEIPDQLERKGFDNLADLLSLEVGPLLFDTTSTYFETEQAEGPVARGEPAPAKPPGPRSAATSSMP